MYKMIGPFFVLATACSQKTTKHFVCASDGAIGKPHGVGNSPPQKKYTLAKTLKEHL